MISVYGKRFRFAPSLTKIMLKTPEIHAEYDPVLRIKSYAKNTRFSRKLKQSIYRCSQLFKYGKRFRYAPSFNNTISVYD